MSANELMSVLNSMARQRPFRPYFIELHSGDRFLVSHPETIIRQKTLFVHHSPNRGVRVFSAAAVAQLLFVPTPPST